MENNSNTDFALYLDIEGFSNRFKFGGKQGIIDLTNDLYELGKNIFEFLSIVQFGGDGFLIKEIFDYQNSIKRFIDIAAALQQIILIRGNTGRVKISCGNLPDIKCLYSEGIQKELDLNNRNILLSSPNKNVMLISPLIGTSIINCYNLKGPKGPLLLIDNKLESKLISENICFNKFQLSNNEVIHINWIKYKNENTEKILSCLDLNNYNIEEKLKIYINQNEFDEEWTRYASQLLKH